MALRSGAMAESPIFEFADRFISEQSALDPCLATGRGIPGFDDQLTDFSPAGHEARADHVRSAVAGRNAEGFREAR